MKIKKALVINGEFVKVRHFTERAAAEFRPRVIDGVPMWRDYVQTPDPVYDPDAEKLEDVPAVITDSTVTASRVIVPLAAAERDQIVLQKLRTLDSENFRILEDLIELLAKKNLIATVQLPTRVQEKLATHKALRAQLS